MFPRTISSVRHFGERKFCCILTIGSCRWQTETISISAYRTIGIELLTAGLVYKPTSTCMNEANFTHNFNFTEQVLILGDLNFDLLDDTKCKPLVNFCDIFYLSNLVKKTLLFYKYCQTRIGRCFTYK